MDANLTANPIEWRMDDYLHFKKCGIITASPDEKCFGLNCIFCKTICLQFQDFIQHIREQHSHELCTLYFTNDDVDEEMTELIAGVEDVEQRNENNNNTNKHNMILNTQSVPMSFPPVTTQVDDIAKQKEVQKIVLELAELESMENMLLEQQEEEQKAKEKRNIEENNNNNNNKNNELVKEDIEAKELAEFLNFKLLPRNICSPEVETSSEHSSSQDSATTTTTISTTATTTTTQESDSKHSKEALSYILEAFKSNKALWDSNHPEYKYNCKKKHYDEIAEQLKADLGYIMTGTDIGRELKKMRNMYRIDLMKMLSHKGLYIPKLWCFERMEFMRKPMEMARRSTTAWKGSIPSMKASGAAEANASTDATSCLISVDVMYKIITAYENHPCLWHVEHPDFRSSIFRKTALNDMLSDINSSMQLNFTLQQLERILKNLRRNYSLEKREQITAEKSPNDATTTYTPTFRYYTELKKFLEPHLGPFSCIHCDEILNTSDQFKIHTSTHDGSSPFVCSICQKGFTSSGNLAIHLRRHRGDFPFECGECGKRVATSAELTIHKRTHTGERPFVCEHCGKDYNSWSFFNIHKRMHLNQPSFVCTVCQKGFYEKRKFVEHMNAHLDIRDKECLVCGKTFTCHNNLKTHMELHAEARKHKCIICGRAFAQAAGLRSHMISLHSEIRTPHLRTRSQLVKYY